MIGDRSEGGDCRRKHRFTSAMVADCMIASSPPSRYLSHRLVEEPDRRRFVHEAQVVSGGKNAYVAHRTARPPFFDQIAILRSFFSSYAGDAIAFYRPSLV